MKKFEEIYLEILQLPASDVITTSGFDGEKDDLSQILGAGTDIQGAE